MSIASELAAVNNTKQSLKNAISSAGVSLTGVPFSGYAAKISEIVPKPFLGAWSQGWYESVYKNRWTRPSWWRPMPFISPNEQKIVILRRVSDNGSQMSAVNVRGNYTVDWGDGSDPVSFTGGQQAQRVYTFAAINQPVQPDGTKQVFITITPQSGHSLTQVDLGVRHTSASASGYASGYLDMHINTPNMTSYTPLFGSISDRFSEVERVVWHNPAHTNTSMSALFRYFRGLRDVVITKTSHVLNMSDMFNGCLALRTIPALDTSAATNTSGMFNGCASLVTIPALNIANTTTTNLMFAGCYSLVALPPLATGNAVNMANMFQGCSSLAVAPNLSFAAATAINSLFISCTSLLVAPQINAPLATNASAIFQQAANLLDVPLLALPAVTSSGLSSMFSFTGRIERLVLSGISYSFSVSGLSLSSDALNSIYAALPTVSGQTLTATHNFGAAGSDISIATAKGWTVVR